MVEKLFLDLLCAEINNVKPSSGTFNLINDEILYKLFKLSKHHDLSHLIANVLEKNNCLANNDNLKSVFLNDRNVAIYRYGIMNYEFERICAVLNSYQIKFIPLKGSVLRTLYPEPWMRTSCDIDILIKKESLLFAIKTLQHELKYNYTKTGGHDAHLFSDNGVHLELHYALSRTGETWSNILNDIWDYSYNQELYCYSLSNEMIYFYHVAHMAMHLKKGGCGVRSFIDLFLLLKNKAYDTEDLNKLLKAGGLLTFNNAIVEVVNNWFGDGQKTKLVNDMEDYILTSGTFGNLKNSVAIAKSKRGGKWNFVFKRIIVPYKDLKFQYPILQKYPVLYPFYNIKRWFRLFKKDVREKSIIELKEATQGNKELQDKVANLLKDLKIY